MQFITLDQRIAVENFEVGVVYTVAFTSGDSFTGSCMGIGVDFVAFQRSAPEYIFCLTMAAAADIAGIEPLGDDIGKILEYTGTVPTTIKTDGTPLLDYLITGKTVQSGTPTPDNPIMPQGCGELETIGAKAGQFKIPISSANTTTPVYLGEVETTRKIKKLVLTGQEGWRLNNRIGSVGGQYFNLPIATQERTEFGKMLCSHYIVANPYDRLTACCVLANYSRGIDVRVNNPSTESDIDNFKAFLAAQYAAGTPVTVWYMLATEETGIVNEPLMRIDNYADTLSYRQSGVNIPTTDGLNIFDIDTTVKPSEVYLKYFSPLF